jgi:hypothetical protein
MCSTAFTPRNVQQKYCSTCAHLDRRFGKPCEVCGVKKRFDAPRCKKCANLSRIDDGKTGQWNRREKKSIEQVIAEAETLGLLPEKQYTFGYVIGVVFGDGCAFPITSRIPHTRSDGTRRYHDSTTYCIKLQVTSHIFANRFAEHWNVLIGKFPRVKTSVRTNFSKSTLKGRSEKYRVQLFTVEPRHTLVGRYLRWLKYESEPSELLRFPLEVMRGFVHGMIDSEGYLNPKKPGFIDIANKNIKLLDTLVSMLERLNCKATVYTYPSQNVSHLVTYMSYTKYGHNM